ncbi:MAG: hypothetical protein RBG1_1C00001G0491 [candidate division Zixibacteria bacterium RBG-1]|nr:MAG: hypothetical protein RBG1_1C00001G0491 [candidate division Zixibacteria bacterium RBG-1]
MQFLYEDKFRRSIYCCLNWILFCLLSTFILFDNSKAEEFKNNSLIKRFQYFDTTSSKTETSLLKDSLKETKYLSMGGYIAIRFALGHHDNLTKEKGQQVPKLRTSNVSWLLHIEGGGFYRRFYTSLFLSLYTAIPNRSFKNGYYHENGSFNMGIKSHVFLLPKKSKFNFLPSLGYASFKEVAQIYSPNENIPDSLDLQFEEYAPIYGLSVQFKFHRDEGLVSLDYLREAHSIGANRYRIQVGGFFTEREKSSFMQGFSAWAFEYVVWNDKRRDWFIMGSVSLDQSDVEDPSR